MGRAVGPGGDFFGAVPGALPQAGMGRAVGAGRREKAESGKAETGI